MVCASRGPNLIRESPPENSVTQKCIHVNSDELLITICHQPSLRGEIKSLEEIVAGRHEAQDAVRARLQREVATLRQQLEARDMGEERLMAAYEEAMASKGKILVVK